jgi:amidase
MIPVVLEDKIAAAEPMATTAGSIALAGSPVSQNAFLTARLRDACAVILGKANLSEWVNFRIDDSSNGWSYLGGQTARGGSMVR